MTRSARTAPPDDPGCPDATALALLGEGGLDDERRAALEGHLAACAACAGVLTELGRLAVPDRVPARYQVVRQLGAGSMGVVWEAEDTRLRRRVALKLIAPEYAERPVPRARFLCEARALARIRHPNVIAVHDLGAHGRELYLALELVDGDHARAWQATAARTPGEVLAVWRQVGRALAAVHEAGLVHRDVKPENVLVDARGHAWLTDFGLASEAGRPPPHATIGALIGTPLYMAPEQLRGEPVSPASDQFAWCIAVWEALVGSRPFRGRTVAALLAAMARPPRVRGTAPGRSCLDVLRRGLDPVPARRWPSLPALIAALDAAIWDAGTGKSVSDPREHRSWVLAGVQHGSGSCLWMEARSPTGSAVRAALRSHLRTASWSRTTPHVCSGLRREGVVP